MQLKWHRGRFASAYCLKYDTMMSLQGRIWFTEIYEIYTSHNSYNKVVGNEKPINKNKFGIQHATKHFHDDYLPQETVMPIHVIK